MKIASLGLNTDPRSQIHIPHSEISSYQNNYVKHPINTWKKPPPEKAKPYTPYPYINSKYRQDFPGHQPQMRQKLLPRVKNESGNLMFNSTSEYFNNYGPKSVPKSNIFIKDNQFVPDKQPFNASTTYGSEFPKKNPNPHGKNIPADVKYPDGYRFNPATTYVSDFHEKSLSIPRNYKPEQKLADKGPHDLSTIYRQDYKDKPQTQIHPVHRMPKYQNQVSHPSQHVVNNKFSGSLV